MKPKCTPAKNSGIGDLKQNFVPDLVCKTLLRTDTARQCGCDNISSRDNRRGNAAQRCSREKDSWIYSYKTGACS
jgi:hypothetical protein